MVGRSHSRNRCASFSALLILLWATGGPLGGSAQADPYSPLTACPPPAVSPAPAEPLVACAGMEGVSVALFDHWMQVAADGEAEHGSAVVPVPPLYGRCIARRSARQGKGGRHPAPSTAKFKLACEREYRRLREESLDFLISSAWLTGEAAALKVELSEAAVHRSFVHIRNQQFPKRSEFRAFLHSSGQTVADLMFRVRLNLLTSRLVKRLAPDTSSFTTRWLAQTSCAAGYAVKDCGQVVPAL